MPASKGWSSDQKLKAYKVTTALYGSLAAFLAWSLNFGSVLQFLLLGFAMVVPPAIAVAYVFYWKRTTELAVFWGILTGFVGGALMWFFNRSFAGIENAEAGGFAQYWFEVCQFLGAEVFGIFSVRALDSETFCHCDPVQLGIAYIEQARGDFTHLFHP